jgi:DeoR/GlpR family transcriptional regulator of sugar metabolism
MMLTMNSVERNARIEALLQEGGFANLTTLCERLQVSEATVRRDLMRLEREGRLQRVWGGAVRPADRSEPGNPWRTPASHEKLAIARAAAAHIQEGQTVILDGGSTVAEVARQLHGRSLQIITNSVPIAEIFYDSRASEVTLTGGVFYPRLGVLLGPCCEQMLATTKADVAVMGIAGITAQGLSNSMPLVVGSERKMIEASARLIIVAEHAKFGRSAMVPVAPLGAANLIITGKDLDAAHRRMLEAANVRYQLA